MLVIVYWHESLREPSPHSTPHNLTGGTLQELSAAQKKRLKKKAKKKDDPADDAAAAAAEAAETAAAAGSKKGPPGGKKVSAAVRKMQEEVEKRRLAEEAARNAEAERIRKVRLVLVGWGCLDFGATAASVDSSHVQLVKHEAVSQPAGYALPAASLAMHTHVEAAQTAVAGLGMWQAHACYMGRLALPSMCPPARLCMSMEPTSCQVCRRRRSCDAWRRRLSVPARMPHSESRTRRTAGALHAAICTCSS